MRRPPARFFNGIVSAIIVVFFLAHGTMGGVSALTGFTSPFSLLVWGGVALIGVHVVASIVTSHQQLADRERPPSARKKRHLALKWATGCLLAVAACVHIVAPRVLGAAFAQSPAWNAAIIVLLSVALAVHLCVGSKSLLKDLEIDRRHKTAFRVVVCAFAAFFSLAVLVAALG